MTTASAAVSALACLRRPRLLIRAARFWLADYDRRSCLRRLFPDAAGAIGADPLPPLLEQEQACEARRRAGDASYSVVRHVELLVALISEAQSAQRAGEAG